jgi:hypothetical protein
VGDHGIRPSDDEAYREGPERHQQRRVEARFGKCRADHVLHDVNGDRQRGIERPCLLFEQLDRDRVR